MNDPTRSVFADRVSPSKQLTCTKYSKNHILSIITKNCLSWIRGKRRNTIYIISWLMRRKLHVQPVCGRAGALTSDPWLCSQSARENGLQKCDLFLRPLAKIRMHFLNVSHLMTKPIKWPLCPAKTQISLCIRLVWSVFAVRSMGRWGPNDSSCGQRRLWSNWADAQADQCLRWAQWPFCWFCHAAAHVYIAAEFLESRASLTAAPGPLTYNFSYRPR